MLEHITARNKILEQQLQIEQGKALLATKNQIIGAEYQAIKVKCEAMEQQANELKDENRVLKTESEGYQKKIKDLETWKSRMKALMDGDSWNTHYGTPK